MFFTVYNTELSLAVFLLLSELSFILFFQGLYFILQCFYHHVTPRVDRHNRLRISTYT